MKKPWSNFYPLIWKEKKSLFKVWFALDGYITLFGRLNYIIGKHNLCNYYVQYCEHFYFIGTLEEFYNLVLNDETPQEEQDRIIKECFDYEHLKENPELLVVKQDN